MLRNRTFSNNKTTYVIIALKNSYLYKSSDLGITWTKINTPSTVKLFDASDNGKTIIYAKIGGNKAVYVSEDYGNTWRIATYYNGIRKLVISGNGYCSVLVQDSPIISTNGHWYYENNLHDNLVDCIFNYDGTYLVTGDSEYTLAYSNFRDGDYTARVVYGYGLYDFISDASGNHVLACSKTRTTVYEQLAKGTFYDTYTCSGFKKAFLSSDDTIEIYSFSSYIKRRKNRGDFETIYIKDTYSTINDIAMSRDGNILIASLDLGIYVSKDSGITWHKINATNYSSFKITIK